MRQSEHNAINKLKYENLITVTSRNGLIELTSTKHTGPTAAAKVDVKMNAEDEADVASFTFATTTTLADIKCV